MPLPAAAVPVALALIPAATEVMRSRANRPPATKNLVVLPRGESYERDYTGLSDKAAVKIAREDTVKMAITSIVNLLSQPVYQIIGGVVAIEALQKAGIVGEVAGTVAEGMLFAASTMTALSKAGMADALIDALAGVAKK